MVGACGTSGSVYMSQFGRPRLSQLVIIHRVSAVRAARLINNERSRMTTSIGNR
ncbi:hypothetical protein PISMIDRAFT_669958 [Pisolithus microcarpus 441]|uniref:Uncharacterized protein n=1 Tax=Pisolithus microcarpus 441 TaxID=765257 RepID=A0A0C9ZNV3_9AGAM|nr:hypothetical protein PISMIDRAFT_669958 [Pisolithus microcarpus 441]